MGAKRGEDMKAPGVGGRLAEVPIGCVLFWGKNSWGIGSVMPYGYLECNGQTVSDKESPLNGVTLPDMNTGSKKFLRGSTTSGTIAGADSANHQHGLSALNVDMSGVLADLSAISGLADLSAVVPVGSNTSVCTGGGACAIDQNQPVAMSPSTAPVALSASNAPLTGSGAIAGGSQTNQTNIATIPTYLEMVPIMRVK